MAEPPRPAGQRQLYQTPYSGVPREERARQGRKKAFKDAKMQVPFQLKGRRNSRGERSPLLPLETRTDSPVASGKQPRDPCPPWRLERRAESLASPRDED